MSKWIKRSFSLIAILAFSIMTAMVSFVKINEQNNFESVAAVKMYPMKHDLLQKKLKIKHHILGHTSKIPKSESANPKPFENMPASILPSAIKTPQEFFAKINPISPAPIAAFANKENVKYLIDFLKLAINKATNGDADSEKLLNNFLAGPYGKLISYFDVFSTGSTVKPITDINADPSASKFTNPILGKNTDKIFEFFNKGYKDLREVKDKTAGIHMKIPTAGVDAIASLKKWLKTTTHTKAPTDKDLLPAIIPSSYEFKAAEINLSNLKKGEGIASFIYKFKKSGTQKIVSSELFMNFKDGILKDEAKNMEDAYKNKDIFFRTLDKNIAYDPGVTPVKFLDKITLANNGIKLVKDANSNTVSIYITLKNTDEAWLSMSPMTKTIDKTEGKIFSTGIKIGFLDNTMSVFHYGKSPVSPADSPATTSSKEISSLKSIREFHAKSKWDVKDYSWTDGVVTKADHIQMYIRENEEINFKLGYKGETNKDVFPDGEQSVKIKAANDGGGVTLSGDTNIQVIGRKFVRKDHAFEIEYKSLLSTSTDFGNWYKIDIYTEKGIFQLGDFEPTGGFKLYDYELKDSARSNEIFFTDPTVEDKNNINKNFQLTPIKLMKKMSKHINKDNVSSRILASLYGSWSGAIHQVKSAVTNPEYTTPISTADIFKKQGISKFEYNTFVWDTVKNKMVEQSADSSGWIDSKSEVEALITYSNSLIKMIKELYKIPIDPKNDNHAIDYLRPEESKLNSFVTKTLIRIIGAKYFDIITKKIKTDIADVIKKDVNSDVFKEVKENMEIKSLFASYLLKGFEIENKWFKSIVDNVQLNTYVNFLKNSGTYKTFNIDSIKMFKFSQDSSHKTDLFSFDDSKASIDVKTGAELIKPLFEYIYKMHLDKKILTSDRNLKLFRNLVKTGALTKVDTYSNKADSERTGEYLEIIKKIVTFMAGDSILNKERIESNKFAQLLSGKIEVDIASGSKVISDDIAKYVEKVVSKKMFSNIVNIKYKWMSLKAEGSEIKNEIIGANLLSLLNYIKRTKYTTLSKENKEILDQIIDGNIKEPRYVAGISVKIKEYDIQKFVDDFSSSEPSIQLYAEKIVDSDLAKTLLIDISGPKKVLNWLSKNSGKVIKYAIFATFGLMALSGVALLIASLSKKMIVAKAGTMRSVGVSVLIMGIIIIGVAVGILPMIEPHEGATLL
ncbi:MAG: hypothetical protein KAG14_00960 [Mycoplasmataceae bacterium]|nr:hypothetical protein [Mycoplasmataceae bacterium]